MSAARAVTVRRVVDTTARTPREKPHGQSVCQAIQQPVFTPAITNDLDLFSH